MPWSSFWQIVILVSLGAHIYSCGKASASIIAPLNNLIERSSQWFERRHKAADNGQSISPTLRS